MRYTKLTFVGGKPVDTEIVHNEPRRCPHAIFVGEHYRANGSCRCDDPSATVMAEWGYVWNSAVALWEAGSDEDE